MYRKLSLPLLLICMLLVAGCTRQSARPAPEAPDSVKVVPLYRYFADRDSAAVLADTALLREFLSVVNYPHDSLSADASMWANSLPVKVFTPAVDSIYGPGCAPLDRYIGYALAAARLEGIDLPRRKYVAVVYGRREPIGFLDSTMFIAMNHYLDPDYEGYQRFPVYERVLKTPEQLPYDIAEALLGTARPFAPAPDGATVLSRMLYSGTIAMGRLLSVDGASEAAALGYTPEQFDWLLEHEAELWRTLVAKQLVYDTDPQTADRLVSPAPATPLLSIYSPGRVGRFIGYRMVRGYLARHPEKRLADLLSPDFYNSPDALSLVDYSPD